MKHLDKIALAAVIVLAIAHFMLWQELKGLRKMIGNLRQTETVAAAPTPDYSTTDDYLMVGNSIMENGNWTQLIGKANIYNSAIKGVTIFEANKIPTDLINRRSKKIFIELGINDLKVKAPVKIVQYEYIRFLNQVRKLSPLSEIYVISVLPVEQKKLKVDKLNESIIDFNTRMTNWVKNNKMTYLDIHAQFKNMNGELDERYSVDGIHLTDKGYEVYASALKAYF